MAKKIALVPGHGLSTPGKQTPDGIKEWTLNDKVRDKVVEFLADYDCEIIHTDNNEGKTDESLTDRVNRYLEAGVDAIVSIHHNAYTSKWNNATGVEVFIDRNPTQADKDLAEAIYSRLVKETGLRGRGIKNMNFTVINQNKIPAVLVEGGFMDGTNDYKVIISDEGQTAYAKAVAEGLIEFLNLKKKTKTQTTKQTEPKQPVKTTKVYFKKYTGKSGSITTALKSVGADSSYANRSKIATANNIAGYKGDASQNLKMLSLLKQGKLIDPSGKKSVTITTKVYFKKYTGKSGSITEALGAVGATTSFAYRSKIAKANGIKAYLGTSAQNTKMLALLKKGKLIKP
jgi:N-acetylmuramoyl-L-alanine amidase